MSKQHLGTILKSLRAAQGMTQVELAAKTGLTQAYLAQLESAVRTNPSLDVLKRIAKALKVDVGKLIT